MKKAKKIKVFFEGEYIVENCKFVNKTWNNEEDTIKCFKIALKKIFETYAKRIKLHLVQVEEL